MPRLAVIVLLLDLYERKDYHLAFRVAPDEE